MKISKRAIEFFDNVGSNAGSVHRVCVHKFGVYPESAVAAINRAASNGSSRDTTALHEEVFRVAKEIDSQRRIQVSHDLTELAERVKRLENRGFLKWLECIFQQETLPPW